MRWLVDEVVYEVVDEVMDWWIGGLVEGWLMRWLIDEVVYKVVN